MKKHCTSIVLAMFALLGTSAGAASADDYSDIRAFMESEHPNQVNYQALDLGLQAVEQGMTAAIFQERYAVALAYIVRYQAEKQLDGQSLETVLGDKPAQLAKEYALRLSASGANTATFRSALLELREHSPRYSAAVELGLAYAVAISVTPSWGGGERTLIAHHITKDAVKGFTERFDRLKAQRSGADKKTAERDQRSAERRARAYAEQRAQFLGKLTCNTSGIDAFIAMLASFDA